MDSAQPPVDRPSRASAARWRHYALPVAAWLAMLLAGLGELDRRIVVATHVGSGDWLAPVLFVSRLGDWEVLLALAFFAAAWLLLHGRRWRLAVLIVGATIVGRLLVELQKALLTRLRPDAFEHPVAVYNYAFPSGHAANSAITFLLLALLLVRDEGRRHAAVAAAAILSLLIGTSRVLLGVHWPSDVIGGWAFGLFWVLLVWQLADPWVDKRDRKSGDRHD